MPQQPSRLLDLVHHTGQVRHYGYQKGFDLEFEREWKWRSETFDE